MTATPPPGGGPANGGQAETRALLHCARLLLAGRDDAVGAALEALRQAFGLAHTRLWGVRVDGGDTLAASIDGQAPSGPLPPPFPYAAFDQWHARLCRGEVLSCDAAAAAGDQRAFLHTLGCTALLAAPVWSKGAIHGFLAFESRCGAAALPGADCARAAGELFSSAIDRAAAENALRLGEERFRQLFDQAMDAIIWVNPRNGVILNCNRAAARLGGREPAALLGWPIADLGLDPPDDDWDRALGRMLADDGDFGCESRLRRPDGRVVPVTVSASLSRVGESPIVQLILHDISERRRREEETRRNQESLRNMFDSLDVGVMILDADGRVRRVNDCALRLFGADRAERILGRAAASLWSPAADHAAPVARVTHTAEALLHTLDDRRLPVLRSRIPMTLDGREVTLESFVDVSDLKRASQRQSEFLANVSHEIRTPLNAIIGFAEIALASSDPDHARGHARTILHEAESLHALINDLLDNAKIESGKMDLEQRPFDLRQVVAEVLDGAAVRARERGLSMTLEWPEDLCRYRLGDPLRLRQVLLNLTGNAVKFTARGGIRVRVCTAGGHPEGLRVEVIDTGIGIPRDKQQAVFERFTQADGSTTRRYGGTGLGITISRQLVRLMGGELGLESAPGTGSTFWFTLALPCCPQAELGLDTRELLAAGCRAPHPARILLAEDYPPNQQVAACHLHSAGHRVHIVGNGAAACAACEGQDFDLILMDVQMPEMDGMEATRRLRARGCRAPILALTAAAEARKRAACLAAGMNDVVTKPIRRVPFLEAVHAWLEDGNADALPAASAAGSDGGCLDRARLVAEFDDDLALVRALLGDFVAGARAEAATLRQALASGDHQPVASIAHKWRGAAANLCAEPLAAAAARLEEAPDQQRRVAGEQVLQELDRLGRAAGEWLAEPDETT